MSAFPDSKLPNPYLSPNTNATLFASLCSIISKPRRYAPHGIWWLIQSDRSTSPAATHSISRS